MTASAGTESPSANSTVEHAPAHLAADDALLALDARRCRTPAAVAAPHQRDGHARRRPATSNDDQHERGIVITSLPASHASSSSPISCCSSARRVCASYSAVAQHGALLGEQALRVEHVAGLGAAGVELLLADAQVLLRLPDGDGGGVERRQALRGGALGRAQRLLERAQLAPRSWMLVLVHRQLRAP